MQTIVTFFVMKENTKVDKHRITKYFFLGGVALMTEIFPGIGLVRENVNKQI